MSIKHPRKKTTPLIFLLFLVFFALSAFIVTIISHCQKIQCISMADLPKYSLKEIYQNTNNIYRALYTNDKDILRVEIRSGINETEAQKSIDAQTARMEALFADATSPYPGDITNEISCNSKFKPKMAIENINGIRITHFTGYLNNRLTFGACTDDQAVNKGIEALFYCSSQRKLYQTEIIAPTSKFNSNENFYNGVLHSIRCK
ncbi:hypothetical protein M1271_00475 [Patescibacteria group bacterium]|nr:hypothetical protein [Patescibacteria group bacterium]